MLVTATDSDDEGMELLLVLSEAYFHRQIQLN